MSKYRISHSDLKQNGNKLQMEFKTLSSSQSGLKYAEMSDNFVLCGLVKFQIRNITVADFNYRSTSNQLISVRFSKIFQTDRLVYSVQLSSLKLDLPSGKKFSIIDNIENARWQTFYENSEGVKSVFDLVVTLDISSSIFSGFNSLHEDTELTDFELRGIDGSVKVHKAVLAGYSPVMKTMLAGNWKETASGFVNVKASEKTLMQLKDFMYLHKLPEGDIEELAMIASLYMMSDLEECCSVMLLTSITAENAADLLDFSVKYNMGRVKLGILQNVQHGLIKVEDMIKKFDDGHAAENQSAHKQDKLRLQSAP